MTDLVLSAGKYAAFVWPAYGISLGALGLAVVLAWRSYDRAKRRLASVGRTADSPGENS